MSVNPLSSETCKMIEGFNFCSSPYFSLVYCWKGVFVLKLKTKFKAQLLNDWKWTLVLKAGDCVPLVFRCTSWMISCHRRTANYLAGRVSVCGIVGFRWPSQWHLCNPRTQMCNLRSLHESLSPIPLLPQAIHTLSFHSGWVPTMLLLHCYTTLLLWWTNYWHRLTHYTKKKKKQHRLQLRTLLALDIKEKRLTQLLQPPNMRASTQGFIRNTVSFICTFQTDHYASIIFHLCIATPFMSSV